MSRNIVGYKLKIALPVLAVLACATFAGDAPAAGMFAYNGSFCTAGTYADHEYSITQVGAFHAVTPGRAYCPFLRDSSVTSLPNVVLEFKHQSSADPNIQCGLAWMDEDDLSGLMMGFSEWKSTATTGRGQFIWDDMADYTGPSSTAFYLSAGGEGTMLLTCQLQQGDEIRQYRVEGL